MKHTIQELNAARSNFFLVKDQSAFLLFLDENELELIYDTGNKNRVGFFTATGFSSERRTLLDIGPLLSTSDGVEQAG